MNQVVTHERLLALLSYDRETGVFAWRVSKGPARVGSVAGCHAKSGYVVISVDRRLYLAHVLAWFYVNAAWPAGEIDHKNRIGSDNRWTNLRDVDTATNAQNKVQVRADSKVGYRGVSCYRGRYPARIRARGETHYLGTYDTPQEAHQVYLSARAVLHAGAVVVDELRRRNGAGAPNP